MTLFLTSDEEMIKKEDNTRTNFSNIILSEFFQDYPFNLALKDIYFDSKFPTIVNFGQPHVVTTIIGGEHKLNEFPTYLQNMSSFKDLFVKRNGVERAFMRVEKHMVLNENISDTDCKVSVEIHPRLNIAISLAYLKDITLDTTQDIVEFINGTMFPFHTKKPIRYGPSGLIEVESDFNIYLSASLMKLLGIHRHKTSDKLKSSISFPSDIQDVDDDLVYPDALARMESNSPLYKKYRELIVVKPKGCIKVVFKLDGKIVTSQVKVDLDFFNFRERRMFVYNDVIKVMNSHMLLDFLSIIEEHVINIATSEREITDLKDFVKYLFHNRTRFGFNYWAGLVSIMRENKQLKITKFHKKENHAMFKNIESLLKRSSQSSELLSNFVKEIFYDTSVISISFNSVLCDLFSIVKQNDGWGEIVMDSENFIAEKQMDYFKAKRGVLCESLSSIPFFLHVMKLQEAITQTEIESPLKIFYSSPEDLYLLSKQKVYLAEGELNRNINAPKLIYICSNFSQHALFGGNQRQILNFFPFSVLNPLSKSFAFKNPIILKVVKGVTYHISLLDENMIPLKADIGLPTLLTLKKVNSDNMFPVTLISSDVNNKVLYPANQSNSFKNKLAFPLLLSDRDKWTVSLHSIAFPKIKNIYPQYCKLSVCEKDSENVIDIKIDSCYITNVSTLISMLNENIRNRLNGSLKKYPTFALKNGRVELNTNNYDVFMEGDMIKLLGFFYSFQPGKTKFNSFDIINGVSEPLLSLFQPQELIILSNIVEEAFYAQKRPSILRVLSVPLQDKFSGYNYIQLEHPENIPLKVDRVDEIEIMVMTRKGDFVEFVNEDDVRVQLQFQQTI